MKLALVAPPQGPGEPLSGGDRYDFELIRALKGLGHEVDDAAPVALVDGILFREWRPSQHRKNVGLVHVPASFLDDDPSLPALEQAFFDRLDAVQFVSELTRDDTARRFRLPARQWVAEPGLRGGWLNHEAALRSVRAESRTIESTRGRMVTGPLDSARGERGRSTLLLLCVGHLVPNKRVREALEVFAQLSELPGWRAEWLGSREVDPGYAAALRPPARVELRGRVPHDEVLRSLSGAAALVTTSRYESWGFAEAEALQAGVPVIGPTHSGLSHALGGAGHVRVDGLELVDALRRIILDRDHREALRTAALAAAARLPTWDRCAELTAAHLEALCNG